MVFFKKFFDFYLNSSIHVAFAAYALLRVTEMYLNLPSQKEVNYFVFFGTITGYNFVKYFNSNKFYQKKITNELKIIQVFSFFCFGVLCFYAFSLPLNTLLISMPFALLTVLYAIPFLNGFENNLRTFGFLKIVIVVLVWAAFTVLVPAFHYLHTISYEVFLVFIQRFFILMVLILPFEIRDLRYDATSLQTIPQKIGIQKTKRLGLFLMLFSLLISYSLNTGFEMKNAFMLFFFLVIIFLMRAKVNQSKYYSSFWVESLPIIWWLLLLVFQRF